MNLMAQVFLKAIGNFNFNSKPKSNSGQKKCVSPNIDIAEKQQRTWTQLDKTAVKQQKVDQPAIKPSLFLFEDREKQSKDVRMKNRGNDDEHLSGMSAKYFPCDATTQTKNRKKSWCNIC